MSDYSSSSSSEDENASDLSLETDRAINVTLMKAVTGEAISDKSISISNELKNGDKKQIQEENREALQKLSANDPTDETDAFLSKYFTERKWESKNQSIKKEEQTPDEDIEEIDSGLEFEKRYNFRNYNHQKEGFKPFVETNPRFIEGSERENENSRKRKRKKEAEEKEAEIEQFNKEMDEIDEKYRKLAEANGGKLTNEQLSAYVDETSKVYLAKQKSAFPYMEVNSEGGIEKSLKILEEEDQEDDDVEDDENNEKKEKKIIKKKDKKDNKKFHKGGNKNRRNGLSESRMNTYFSHRHK